MHSPRSLAHRGKRMWSRLCLAPPPAPCRRRQRRAARAGGSVLPRTTSCMLRHPSRCSPIRTTPGQPLTCIRAAWRPQWPGGHVLHPQSPDAAPQQHLFLAQLVLLLPLPPLPPSRCLLLHFRNDLLLALGLDRDGAGGRVVDAALQLAPVCILHRPPRLLGLWGPGGTTRTGKACMPCKQSRAVAWACIPAYVPVVVAHPGRMGGLGAKGSEGEGKDTKGGHRRGQAGRGRVAPDVAGTLRLSLAKPPAPCPRQFTSHGRARLLSWSAPASPPLLVTTATYSIHS